MLRKFPILFYIALTMLTVNAHDNKSAEGTPLHSDASTSTMLNKEDVLPILDKLSAEDKKNIEAIQKQILSWPKETFEEVKTYREFVIAAHKKAEDMYNALSPEAKEAISIEAKIKEKLSPDSIKLLEQIRIINK